MPIGGVREDGGCQSDRYRLQAATLDHICRRFVSDALEVSALHTPLNNMSGDLLSNTLSSDADAHIGAVGPTERVISSFSDRLFLID